MISLTTRAEGKSTLDALRRAVVAAVPCSQRASRYSSYLARSAFRAAELQAQRARLRCDRMANTQEDEEIMAAMDAMEAQPSGEAEVLWSRRTTDGRRIGPRGRAGGGAAEPAEAVVAHAAGRSRARRGEPRGDHGRHGPRLRGRAAPVGQDAARSRGRGRLLRRQRHCLWRARARVQGMQHVARRRPGERRRRDQQRAAAGQ